ncbi:MAG: PD-(D/E)XK nuclease family protein [Christensenellales bacterium]|jgi:ATP-dependent helicase/nuclease subunit B
MLTVITGRSCAGKTRYLLSLAASRAKAKERVLLLLPEPNTYDGELAMMDALSGPLFNCEVLGMARLARRVLDSAGGGVRLFLSAEGRRMALRRIIDEKKSELTLFSGVSVRSGFTERAGELIDLFKNADILPFDLKNAANQLGEGLLASKLRDFSVLYAGLLDFMAGKYMDRADALRLLCEKMEGSDYLRGLHVFFDSPHGFLYDKRTFAILNGLIRNCASVTMTLRLSDPMDGDRELFALEERVLLKLSELSPFERIHLKRGDDGVPAGIRALERRLFAPGNQPEPDGSGITICAATTPSEERQAVCERVMDLLKNGAKPGDLYIVTASEKDAAPLRADMARLGLPLFMDERRPLSQHPLVEFILSSLSACLHSFRREDVLRVAKNAFSPIPPEQAEALQDYCIRFGISFGAFLQPFERGVAQRPRLAAAAEQARSVLLSQLLAFAESLKSCTTSADCCRSLYDYLMAADVPGRLSETGERLTALGRAEAESINAQAYDAVIDLLDQIAELMDGEMGPQRFLSVLDEGFAARTIGLLPPAADAIPCGDSQTASGREMRHLIVMGAADGTLPQSVQDDGMIDNGDIDQLLSVGIDAFYSQNGRAIHERHITYALLSRPTASLFLSYSETDESGAPAARSEAADRLVALFPQRFFRYSPKPAIACTHPEQGFAALLRGLQVFLDSGTAEEGLQQVFAHYASDPAYKDRLHAAITRMFFGASGMAPEDAKALYGSWKGSTVTRLEAFNRCPFAYLVDYGLRPDEKKEFDEHFSDEGSYLHDAFCAFFKAIREEGTSFAELSDEQALTLLCGILDELEKTHNNGWFFASSENMHTAALLRRAAQRSVLAMLAQIRSGRFFPLLEEAELGKDLPAVKIRLPDGTFAELVGRIDRLDAYQGKNAVYVRVIDYKTGDKAFSLDELVAGVQLQLPLYLRAATKIGLPAGMFYLRVADHVLDAEKESDGLKRYKLRGVLLCDEEVARAMDDRSTGWSDIIPVQFTKDGLSKKNSAVLSAEGMEETLQTAEHVAAATIARILSGECGANPYGAKGVCACDYCDYASICRYEPRRRGR